MKQTEDLRFKTKDLKQKEITKINREMQKHLMSCVKIKEGGEFGV